MYSRPTASDGSSYISARDDAPPDFSAHYVCGLEHYVRYCLTAGQTPRLGFDPAAVLVCSDLFCGVVPADPALRAWREATGHYLARLSSQAARVTRVFAGLPPAVKITHYGSGRRVGQ